MSNTREIIIPKMNDLFEKERNIKSELSGINLEAPEFKDIHNKLMDTQEMIGYVQSFEALNNKIRDLKSDIVINARSPDKDALQVMKNELGKLTQDSNKVLQNIDKLMQKEAKQVIGQELPKAVAEIKAIIESPKGDAPEFKRPRSR